MLKCLNVKMSKRGFTLIEVIVSILVVTVGVSAAYIVIQQIISYTYQVSSRLTAAYLAKEGIEIVRNIRDTNWIEGEDWDEGLKNCYASENKYCEADYNDTQAMTRYGILCVDPPCVDQFQPLKINSGFYSYENGPETKFYREIITKPGANLEVTVLVWWAEKGKTYGPVTVQEVLYDWYQ